MISTLFAGAGIDELTSPGSRMAARSGPVGSLREMCRKQAKTLFFDEIYFCM
jgi:hypothetical protein